MAELRTVVASFGFESFFVCRVVELQDDVALAVGSVPSETTAIVLPSGESTGWRIQENHVFVPA